MAIFSFFNQAIADGGSPHASGNFFNGQSVDDPGPLFYPVALALRLAPWTLVGCVLGMLALLAAPKRQGRTAALVLFSFVATFLIVLTVMAKKFDRYALPTVPVLVVLAAYGINWLWDQGSFWLPTLRANRRPTNQWVWALLIGILAINVVIFQPYPLSYYDPLLGGGAAATRLIPVGWGEGLEQAGAFIANQPDGCIRPIATFYAPVLRPFVCNRIVSLDDVDKVGEVGYAVLYIDQIQRGDRLNATIALQQRPPLKVIQINGIPYAYVYQLQPPVAETTQAVFESTIQFTGYTIAPLLQSSSVVTITTAWFTPTPVEHEDMLFIHLFNRSGTRVGQVDVPLGGDNNLALQWQPQRFQLQEVTIPVHDSADQVTWATMGLYDPQTTQRLPLTGSTPPTGAPDDGPNVVVIRF
jgi:hypothetical protein